jgi:Ca2+/Na+ antiporter
MTHAVAAVLSEHAGLMLVAGAGVAFYAAARATADALGGGREPSAAVLTLSHWLPIALVAALAALMNQPEIAVGAVFATSVAVLSLVLGLVMVNKVGGDAEPLPASARAWTFLLPASLLVFVAGFSGRLTPLHGLFLLVQGGVILAVWRGDTHTSADTATSDELSPAPSPRWRLDPFRIAELALALVLGLLGAWAAVNGALRMSYEQRVMTPGLVAASVVGPLLVLPMVGSGTLLARLGRAQTATSAVVAVVLLNLCALLPLVVLLSTARPLIVAGLGPMATVLEPPSPPPVRAFDDGLETEDSADAATMPADAPATAPMSTTTTTTTTTTQPTAAEIVPPPVWTDGIPYPMAAWRLDTVILMVLGLVVLPVAVRRWALSRRDGLLLVIAYALYLTLTAILGRRWG